MGDTGRSKPPSTGALDLEHRYKEVRLLVIRRWGCLVDQGVDLEDLLQHVCLALLIRARGTNPYDPEKGSWSHYVHVVASGAVVTYLNRHHRRHRRETVGLDGIVVV